jgi:gliding motility-associated-like protein
MAGFSSAQIDVNVETPENLIQNILVGQGVTVSNITSAGNAAQFGRFANGQTTNLGIASGVVMTTGDVNENVAGPNDQTGLTSSILPDEQDDPDLTTILTSFGVGGVNRNVCILEFDFIPNGDSLAFNFVFGSEEYDEYVCSNFFDAFGFFLSGPGINGPYTNNAVNLAVVPGTNLPIGINTVNNGTVGQFGTVCPAGGLANAQYYQANTENSLQMDGFTRLLTAQANVQCNQTYHIKLVIANGTDTGLDSWVFLQAESFASNIPDFQIANLLPDTSVIEGCTIGDIILTRHDATMVLSIPVIYGGTAISGVDYEPLPDTIFFPVGVDTISFSLTPIVDGIEEGYEDILIQVRLITECGDTIIRTSTVYIRDEYELTITTPQPVLRCPDDNYSIAALVEGGYPPYQYQWEYNNLTTPSINVPIASTDTFRVTITDSLACSFAVYEEQVIVRLGYDSLQTEPGQETICAGDTIQISPSFFRGLQPYTFQWDGVTTTETIPVFPSDTTLFVYTVTDSCGISATDTFTVFVPEYDPLIVTAFDTTICKNSEAILAALTEGGNGEYTWLWSGPGTITVLSDSTASVEPLTVTQYVITVTDGCETVSTDTMTVELQDCQLQVGNAFSPNGDGFNDFFEIANIQFYPNNTVFVYNRWGKKVLEQTGYTNNWGADNDVTAGTYFYVVDPGDGTDFLKGYVTIFKN